MAKMKKKMIGAKKGILTKKKPHGKGTKNKTNSNNNNNNTNNNNTNNNNNNNKGKYNGSKDSGQTDNKNSSQKNKYNNSRERFNKKKANESSDDSDDEFEVVEATDNNKAREGTADVDIGETLTTIETADTRQMVKAQNRKQKKSGGFQAMGLSHNVFKGITRKGYKLPTPIQRKTVPLIMDGKDVVAMARTGSGKTAAFLIPMFEKLQAHSNNGARAVILSPTRELALQTMKFTKELGKYMDLKTSLILGGDSMENQFAELHQNPDILIATPGRFLHILVEMDIKRLDNIEYIVFDEADRLFEMGFAEQLHEIIRRVPESRQTLLFSATLPKVLVDFTSAGLTDPTLIRLDVDTKISDKLKMAFFMIRPEDKTGCLLHLLQSKISAQEQTLIFVSTKHHVEFLQELLTKVGISCSYIYSSLDQTARKIHLAKFRKKLAMVLIVTDIAARGIDIPMLDNVINFDFPSKPKIFVHRVGRVARAGRSGMAYSMVVKDELAFVYDLHLFLGRPLKFADDSHKEDEDGVLGSIQQTVIATEVEYANELSTTDFTLKSMHKVMENGYRGYIRTRESASEESIRRSKEMNQMVIQVHPLFKKADNTNENLTKLLYDLQKFKPKVTVFESQTTKKSKDTEAIMKEKRKYHTTVIERTKQKVQEKEKEAANLRKDVKTSVTDEQYVAETFHTKSYKDTENFIPRQSSDFHGERGFTVKSFEKDAKSVSVDVAADDGSQMKQNHNAKKWDRKRKKFVSAGGSSTKKMKTESGNYINASYKSRRYSDWVKSNNITGGMQNRNGSDNDEDGGSGINQTKGNFSHNKRFGGGRGDRGDRGRGVVKGGGGGGKIKGVLKSKDEIVKNRIKAEREKSWLKKKGGRGGGGRGGGGRGGRGGGRGGSRGGGGGSRGGGRGGSRGGSRGGGRGGSRGGGRGRK